MAELTAEVLRSKLTYNPETGVFIWRVRAGKAWPGRVAGSPDSWGHTQIRINTRKYATHRLAWLYVHGEWPKQHIDHIDGNPANNALRNLREVDMSVNQQNLRKAKSTNKCGLLGVSRKANYSVARIKVGDRVLFLGTFETNEEAHAAYLNAKRRFHPGCTI
jgi:hypothetical protein